MQTGGRRVGCAALGSTAGRVLSSPLRRGEVPALRLIMTFAEYAAVNGAIGESPNVVNLLATATVYGDGGANRWLVEGSPTAFLDLQRELQSAMWRTSRARVSEVLKGVITGIGDELGRTHRVLRLPRPDPAIES